VSNRTLAKSRHDAVIIVAIRSQSLNIDTIERLRWIVHTICIPHPFESIAPSLPRCVLHALNPRIALRECMTHGRHQRSRTRQKCVGGRNSHVLAS
jgi:hypothetical protein